MVHDGTFSGYGTIGKVGKYGHIIYYILYIVYTSLQKRGCTGYLLYK